MNKIFLFIYKIRSVFFCWNAARYARKEFPGVFLSQSFLDIWREWDEIEEIEKESYHQEN